LVPNTILIHNSQFWPSPAGGCSIPLAEIVSLLINYSSYFHGPLLLGRENIHWSSFFQGDASAIDGIYWNEIGTEDGYSKWEQSNAPPFVLPSVTPSGLRHIQLTQQYNDLDLLIMGVKTPNEAYSPTNQFRWMEPSLAEPLEYLAGLFIAFSRSDFLYFGFCGSHRQLGVQQTGATPTTFNLSNYRPLMSEFNNIALRIVRRGDDYYFQAKFDSPSESELNARLLRNIDPLPRKPDPENATLDRFRTLLIRRHAGTPRAVGLIVKTWFKAAMCDAVFLNLEVKDGSTESVLSTDVLPPLWTYSSPGYASLPSNSLVFDRPAEGAFLRRDGSRIHIVTPFVVARSNASEWPSSNQIELIAVEDLTTFDHTSTVDRAPKVMTKSPSSNFAIATSARINRSAFTPWAGGYALGKTMWGRVQTALSQSVEFNDQVRRKQSDPAISSSDPRFTYKNAFIVLARDRSEFLTPAGQQKISNTDTIRRYWDTAFDVLTLRRRHSSSTL
jgi:hypothetical protein